MAFDLIVEGAYKLIRVDQGHELMRFCRSQQVRVQIHVTTLGHNPLEPVKACLGSSEHHASGHMQPDILPRLCFDFSIQLHCVLLQFCNVRVTVDGVHAASCVPRGAGGKLRPFQQSDVGPAKAGQVVQDRAADYTTTDDDNASVSIHVLDVMPWMSWFGLYYANCGTRSEPAKLVKPLLQRL